jgi:hypothetical protein
MWNNKPTNNIENTWGHAKHKFSSVQSLVTHTSHGISGFSPEDLRS